MKRIKFYFNAGYVGSDITEIFEFPDDITEEEIEEKAAEWYEEQRCDEYSWSEATDKDVEKYGIENEGEYEEGEK